MRDRIKHEVALHAERSNTPFLCAVSVHVSFHASHITMKLAAQ